MQTALVSAIVTTTGRSCALAAVASALCQTLEDVEVVVVFDGPAEECMLALPKTSRLRVVSTGRRAGGGPARTLGVRTARGRFVAFLDDDDTWLPEKLEVQLDLAARQAGEAPNVLVSSRALVVDPQDQPQLVVPHRLIGRQETVADYLFSRRRIRFGESLLHTSTLLCERRLALGTAWSNLAIHQDWDWLLRLTQANEVRVLMAEQALTRIGETPGSVSRAANWRASLEWAMSSSDLLSKRQLSDFLLCVTAPYAKDAGEQLAALRIGCSSLRRGRPSLPALIFFLLYVLGPSRLLKWLVRLWAKESQSFPES